MTQSNNQRPAQPPQRTAVRSGTRPQNPQQAGQMRQRPMQGAGTPPTGRGAMPQGTRPMQGRSQNPAQMRQTRPTGTSGMQPVQGARPMQGTRPMQGVNPTNPMQNASPYRMAPTQGQIPPQSAPQNLVSSFQRGQFSTQTMALIAVLILVVGIIMGAMMFGGSSKPAQQAGLQGVVKNTDIRTKLPRCGRIDRGQACILYIMNSTRYDQIAESFFEEALRLTEVPIYSISMANPKYAKRRIPPGHFAEIQIPKVR